MGFEEDGVLFEGEVEAVGEGERSRWVGVLGGGTGKSQGGEGEEKAEPVEVLFHGVVRGGAAVGTSMSNCSRLQE